jgi:hypothetical protein
MRTNEISQYDQQAFDFLTKHGIKFRATLSDSKTPAWAKDGEECGHHYRVTLSREGWKPDRRKGWEKIGQGAHLTTLHATDLHPSRNRLVFDFWNSIADAQAPKKAKSSIWKSEQKERDIVNAAQIDAARVTSGEWKRKRAEKHAAELEVVRAEIDRLKPELELKHPSSYSVLACISGEAYTPDTFADFCAEYCYESDSIKALQQYRRCLNFSRRLKAFFTEKELNELSEIQ